MSTNEPKRCPTLLWRILSTKPPFRVWSCRCYGVEELSTAFQRVGRRLPLSAKQILDRFWTRNVGKSPGAFVVHELHSGDDVSRPPTFAQVTADGVRIDVVGSFVLGAPMEVLEVELARQLAIVFYVATPGGVPNGPPVKGEDKRNLDDLLRHWRFDPGIVEEWLESPAGRRVIEEIEDNHAGE